MFHRKEGGRSPGGDADLAIGALDVVVRRLGRDVESAGHLLGVAASRHEADDFGLAFGETLGVVHRWGWKAAHIHDRLHRLGIVEPVGGLGAQDGGGFLRGTRGPVSPWLSHGMERIDGCEESRGR